MKKALFRCLTKIEQQPKSREERERKEEKKTKDKKILVKQRTN